VTKASITALLMTAALAISAPMTQALADRRPPANQEECLAQLKLLVEEAHAADLLDDQIDHAENFVALMEQACLANNFDDAWTFATEIDRILETNK
jgi:hypothetical protein